jgi:hypothetical protein
VKRVVHNSCSLSYMYLWYETENKVIVWEVVFTENICFLSVYWRWFVINERNPRWRTRFINVYIELTELQLNLKIVDCELKWATWIYYIINTRNRQRCALHWFWLSDERFRRTHCLYHQTLTVEAVRSSKILSHNLTITWLKNARNHRY